MNGGGVYAGSRCSARGDRSSIRVRWPREVASGLLLCTVVTLRANGDPGAGDRPGAAGHEHHRREPFRRHALHVDPIQSEAPHRVARRDDDVRLPAVSGGKPHRRADEGERGSLRDGAPPGANLRETVVPGTGRPARRCDRKRQEESESSARPGSIHAWSLAASVPGTSAAILLVRIAGGEGAYSLGQRGGRRILEQGGNAMIPGAARWAKTALTGPWPHPLRIPKSSAVGGLRAHRVAPVPREFPRRVEVTGWHDARSDIPHRRSASEER